MRLCLLAFLIFLTVQATSGQDVTDVDGNIYGTVKIGTQVWLAENLKTTKLSDGAPISLANTDQSLQNFIPSYTWFGYDEAGTKSRYGALYNFYAVDTKKICPAGWHVPSDVEWNTLAGFLEKGGYGFGGEGSDIAKALAAKAGWALSAETGTPGNDQQRTNNGSGFSALPGGARYFNGKADSTGSYGFWWSATEFYTTNAWSRGLLHNKNYLFRLSYGKRTYMSVRCIRD